MPYRGLDLGLTTTDSPHIPPIYYSILAYLTPSLTVLPIFTFPVARTSLLHSRRWRYTLSILSRWRLLLPFIRWSFRLRWLAFLPFQGRQQQWWAGLVSWLWLFDDTVLWFEWWLRGEVLRVLIFVRFGFSSPLRLLLLLVWELLLQLLLLVLVWVRCL